MANRWSACLALGPAEFADALLAATSLAITAVALLLPNERGRSTAIAAPRAAPAE